MQETISDSVVVQAVSDYRQFIHFINEQIPFIGEPFTVLNIEMTATEIVLPITFLIIINLVGNLFRSILINKILPRYIHDRKTVLSIGNTTKYVILVLGLAILFSIIGLDKTPFLNKPLNDNVEHPLTFIKILKVIFYLTLLAFFSSKLKSVFVKQILSRYSDDIGVSSSRR